MAETLPCRWYLAVSATEWIDERARDDQLVGEPVTLLRREEQRGKDYRAEALKRYTKARAAKPRRVVRR